MSVWCADKLCSSLQLLAIHVLSQWFLPALSIGAVCLHAPLLLHLRSGLLCLSVVTACSVSVIPSLGSMSLQLQVSALVHAGSYPPRGRNPEHVAFGFLHESDLATVQRSPRPGPAWAGVRRAWATIAAVPLPGVLCAMAQGRRGRANWALG